jgi:hypothetical protein
MGFSADFCPAEEKTNLSFRRNNSKYELLFCFRFFSKDKEKQ